MSILTLTDKAQDHFFRLIEQDGTPNLNLRIEVSNPGTKKAEIGLTYCPENKQEANDLEMAFDKFKLYIAKNSKEALKDANIDYATNDMGGELVFKAPNIFGKKLDKNAPLLDQINSVVKSEINPMLANHGGSLTVADFIEATGELQIVFNGGCQGCGMARVTLNDFIEKTLATHFPTLIKQINDITDHGY